MLCVHLKKMLIVCGILLKIVLNTRLSLAAFASFNAASTSGVYAPRGSTSCIGDMPLTLAGLVL